LAETQAEEMLERAALSVLDELPAYRAASDLLYLPASLAGQPVLGEEPPQTHVPAFPELVFVREGVLRLASPAGVLLVFPGQLLVIPAAVEHGEIWEGEYDAVLLPIQGSNVHFYRRRSHPPDLVSIHLLGRTDLTYIAEGLLRELAAREAGFEDSVYGLLLHLHSLLLRRVHRGSMLRTPLSDDPPDANPHAWLVVQRTLEYLSAHLGDPIDAEDAAQHMRYSLVHLNRFLLRVVGKSVSRCLRDLRMTHARDLLRHSDLSVARIADRVGYSDASNFRRAFKQAVGVGLKEYRRGDSLPGLVITRERSRSD
jgi:AraC-like DNA-binding protein